MKKALIMYVSIVALMALVGCSQSDDGLIEANLKCKYYDHAHWYAYKEGGEWYIRQYGPDEKGSLEYHNSGYVKSKPYDVEEEGWYYWDNNLKKHIYCPSGNQATHSHCALSEYKGYQQ